MNRVGHFLDGFFMAKSIAIVGATANPHKINFNILKNLINLNFLGRIYPVNITEKEILGIKAYPRLKDIPNMIDVVVSAVPASGTLDIVRECETIGVKNLIIVQEGFQREVNGATLDIKKLNRLLRREAFERLDLILLAQ